MQVRLQSQGLQSGSGLTPPGLKGSNGNLTDVVAPLVFFLSQLFLMDNEPKRLDAAAEFVNAFRAFFIPSMVDRLPMELFEPQRKEALFEAIVKEIYAHLEEYRVPVGKALLARLVRDVVSGIPALDGFEYRQAKVEAMLSWREWVDREEAFDRTRTEARIKRGTGVPPSAFEVPVRAPSTFAGRTNRVF